MRIPKHALYRAKPENLLRLAQSLKLRVDGMKHRQIARFVYWRITRKEAWRRKRLEM